uniref:Uncharacterized protein LOC114349096 n=1 Tax=Diabrotica virgifera virgifera TaxID=50390 RepID=A0A6P7HI49_DIAVI
MDPAVWPKNACVNSFFIPTGATPKSGLSFNPNLMLLNIQSINSDKICDVILELNSHKSINIICLTELWESNDSIGNVNIEGFILASCYLRGNSIRGGGVGIWVRKGLNFNFNNKLNSRIKQYCVDKHSEFCIISFKDKKNNSYVILNCYRSPSGDLSIFLNNLEGILNYLYKPNIRFVICGDFNVDTRNMTNDHVNLFNVLLNFNINFNLVNWPNRVTDTSVTTLDN